MIRAELRYLHSPDVRDLERFAPDDGEYFGLLVQAMIGPSNGIGEESFDFLICSPRWLANQLSSEEHIFGRHYLFLAQYNYGAILRAIRTLCDQATGEDWQAVAAYLSRYGRWEFEDYQEYRGES